MTTSTNELIEAFGSMTVMEMVELTKAMEERFQVAAATPIVRQVAEQAEQVKVEEQKTSFNVRLDSFGQNRLNVIKAARELLGIGLKETMDLVNKAPVVLKENVEQAQADLYVATLTAAGATVTLE